jgi:aminoglycoside phosphotransferase (APT) family kinase protein
MADLQPRLQAYLEGAFPEFESPQVAEMLNLNNGWESDVYAFEVLYGPSTARTRQSMILRIFPGTNAEEKARSEYRAIDGLYRMGYPVPQVYRLETSSAVLDQPFILMEKIEGRLLWPLLFHGPLEQQPALLSLFCQLLLRLHQLDWQPYIPEETEKLGDPLQYARRMVDQARWALQTFNLPEWQPLVEWFEKRLLEVPCLRPGVVHMDFHPNNILMRADGSPVVIDWTGAAISDPRFDLAWTLLLVECFEGAAWRERVRTEYERQLGSSLSEMDFFDAFACGRRILSVAVSIKAGAGALGMRPGAEQIMKAQVEPLRRVAARLHLSTGLPLLDVEQLLTG